MDSTLRFQILLSILILALLFKGVKSLPTHLLSRAVTSCPLSAWEDLVTFYILNYGVHAFTVKPFPGEKPFQTTVWTIAALSLPFSGILKACLSIAKGKLPGEIDIQHAARVGALCMVVRTEE
jgi:hypothetical protein